MNLHISKKPFVLVPRPAVAKLGASPRSGRSAPHPAPSVLSLAARSLSQVAKADDNMLNYGTENLVAPPAGGPSPRAGRFACSQQSVLRAIDRFVSAVDNMDATVLVPSRLRDMAVQNRRKPHHPLPPGVHQHQDLHSFYNMLKDVKNELLWGPSSVDVSLFDSLSSMSSPRVVVRGTTTPLMTTGMTTPRQASDDGLGSSVGCSDTDSDFESIVADRESLIMEQTSHLATAFRHHLHGLHAILHQLADSADYLSSRYQEEIESP